ncbi:MAG TPA: hypothetical protein ENK83_07600 [Aliiroseovarius sp.]|nr:hypothetical protein [Aliiroseovarius sp.]
METAIRDKNLGRCQSGGWPGGADNGGGAELITIPTGMAGPGVNCVPERRAKGQGGTMDAAIQDARRNWERLVARLHGGEYAHSEKAVEAEFRCVQQRGSASCELIGTPCRGPGGGAGGDQGQPANSREFPAGTQAQMAECKPEMRAAGAGNAYNIAGARARQAWEQSVKSLYGNRYANLDNAHAAKYSCAPGNGGVICEAIGLPCRP